MLGDLKPRFLRFPGKKMNYFFLYHLIKKGNERTIIVLKIILGGSYSQGRRLMNAFRWKSTVGPWEQRPGHFNDVWNYWTDDGLGFFEFLQVCISRFSNLICLFKNVLSCFT